MAEASTSASATSQIARLQDAERQIKRRKLIPPLTGSYIASNTSAPTEVDSLPHSDFPPYHYPAGWRFPPPLQLPSFVPTAPVNGTHQYNDLPTPTGYPGAQYRSNSSEQSNNTLNPFIPNHYSSVQTLNGPPLDSTAYMPHLPHGQPTSSTQAGNGFTRGDGTSFSSAFGLMSLDDPAVLAGISTDGTPFFERAMASTDGVGDSQAFLAANQHASFLPPDRNSVQAPNSRDRENELKDMWAAFLRDPNTGLKPDGTEMERPRFPWPAHPQIHRGSSSYGGADNTSKAANQLMQQQTGDFNNITVSRGHQGQPNVVQGWEARLTKLEGVATLASTVFSGNADSLKNYEEAVLSRKAPVLKLPARTKRREGAASSSTGRTPTVEGAKNVRVGSDLRTGPEQHLQTYGSGERPIIAMPRPRSRRSDNMTKPPIRFTSDTVSPGQNGDPDKERSSPGTQRDGITSIPGLSTDYITAPRLSGSSTDSSELQKLMEQRRPKDLTGRVKIEDSHNMLFGGFSVVNKGTIEGRIVAIKRLKVKQNDWDIKKWEDKFERQLKREMDVWAALSHPNILEFLGFCTGFGKYKWCQFGTASFYLRSREDIKVKERLRLVVEVNEGLIYLHGLGIIHGDLKPDNVLIDDDHHARLCDFGLVRLHDWQGPAGMTTTSPYTGSARYKAPELFATPDNPKPEATMAGDVYALGCIVLEFVKSRQPYHDSEYQHTMEQEIRNGKPPAHQPPTQDLTEAGAMLWRLMDRCWSRQYEQRPTAKAAIKTLGRVDSMMDRGEIL